MSDGTDTIFRENLKQHLDGRVLASDNGITFRDRGEPSIKGRYSVGPESEDQEPAPRVQWFTDPGMAYDHFIDRTNPSKR